MRLLCIGLVFTASLALAQETPPPLVDAEPPGSCARNTDCAATELCVDYQALADGTWTRGVCRPKVAQATEGQQLPYRGVVPEGFHLVEAPRTSLITPGVILFAAGYGLSAAFSLAIRQPLGLIPYAGPIIVASEAWLPGGFLGLGYVLDFLLLVVTVAEVATQVVGTVLLIAGVSNPKRWLERIPVAIVPTATQHSMGLGVVGRF